MPSWFLDDESEWLRANYLQGFKDLDRHATTIYNGKSMSALQAFLAEAIDEFAQKFPYRYYKTPIDQIPEELRDRQLDTAESWSSLTEKFRNRLQYMKRNESQTGSMRIDRIREEDLSRGDQSRKSEEGQLFSDEQSNLPGESEPTSNAELEEWTDEEFEGLETKGQQAKDPISNNCSQADAPSSGSLRAGLNLHHEHDFQYSETDLSLLNTVLQTLKEFTQESWAECDKQKLYKRQSNIPLLVQHIMDLIHHGTGCELYTAGVLVIHHQHHAFSVATSRSLPYLESKNEILTREHFATFTATHIGPNLCTNIQCPNPTVTGDPESLNRPVLPSPPDVLEQEQRNLHDYFTALMRWQGGVDIVPYSIIAEQNSKGEYDIVSHSVYPPGVSQLSNPFAMTAEETRAWSDHILAGDRMQIPEECRFQFDLPRPGLRVNGYQSQRAPRAKIGYLPHALAYARALKSYAIDYPSPRSDQLPVFQSRDVPYSSLIPEDYAGITAGVQSSQECVKMLEALKAFDSSFPIHAGVEFWQQRSENMPHLKSQPPSPSSSVDHLVADGGWLPPECYDISHPDYYLKGIVRLLAWSHPRDLTHSHTGTLLGGPYGVKWAVLMLCHVQINMNTLENNWSEAIKYYGDLAIRGKVCFLNRDLEQLHVTIDAMTIALENSTKILRNSIDQRRVIDSTELANGHALRSHAEYPTNSDGFIFHTLEDDRRLWEAAVSDRLVDNKRMESAERGTSIDDTMESARLRKGKEKAFVQANRKRSKRNYSGDYAETVGIRTRRRKVSFSPHIARRIGTATSGQGSSMRKGVTREKSNSSRTPALQDLQSDEIANDSASSQHDE